MALNATFPTSYSPFAQKTVADTAVPQARRRSIFARLLDAMMEARQRQAEREIARILTLHGGTFTDEIERLISRQLR